MNKPLPGVGTLIGESWRLFVSSWNDTIKISIWILYTGLAYFVVSLLAKFVPAASFLTLAVGIASVFVSLWAAIRLIQIGLEVVDGKKPTLGKQADQSAINLILPLLWVAILQFLITLAGFILFIIPGIYLAICLTFSQIILIGSGIRGSKALQTSRELVKGRWWGVLWRIFAGGFVFSLALGIVSALIFFVLGMLIGTDSLKAGSLGQPLDPLVDGTITLLQSTIQAACIALFVIFQTNIFRALQKTKQ